jgi:arylsulfatase A-like enzyme
MTRSASKTVVGLLLLLHVVACGPQGDTPDGVRPQPPNVVLVIIDTLRADMLSSYGHPDDPSPALSRLAAEGVQFDQVIAQTSWTLPSVGSLLTSQYPRTLGLYVEDGGVVPDSFQTLAEVLAEQGFGTFGITANPNLNARFAFDRGFDTYVDSVVVFGRDKDDVPEGKLFFRDEGVRLHTAREIFTRTMAYVDQADSGRPHYIQLDLMEVHEHLFRDLLRPEYYDLFPGSRYAAYLRRVRQVTDDLETFVKSLRRRPGWEDTLFCVLSDHGEGLQDHPGVKPSRGHGSLLYESQVRVPWLMFREGWTPAVNRIEQRVRLLDVLPTLLGYLDLQPPPDMQGVSLMPWVAGRDDDLGLPEFVVTETFFRGLRKIGAYGDDWQYFHNRAEGHDGLPVHELQSFGAPPDGVLTDRSAEHPDMVMRMQRYLSDWEARHDEARPVLPTGELPDDVRRQLEAIGYFR